MEDVARLQIAFQAEYSRAQRKLASQGVAHLKLSAANDVQGAMYSKDALLSELNLLELGLLASLSSAVPS